MAKCNKLPLKLQFFAEPSDPIPGSNPVPGNDPTPAVDSTPSPSNLDTLLQGVNVDELFNHPSLQKALQSRQDSAITKALNTARSKWEQEANENLDEAKKLEKMTAEQREKYKFEKEKQKFESDRKKFEHEQLTIATGNELLKRGIDASFAKMLTADTAEATNANIETFEKMFNSAVSAALNTKMKGQPPKDVAAPKEFTKEQIAMMSTSEINANWEAVSRSLQK